MYKHILIPTDGSEASAAAIAEAVKFAREIGATITGIHVMPEMSPYAYEAEVLADTFEQFNRATEDCGKAFLGVLAEAAKEAGIGYSQVCVRSAQPYQAIIDTAVAEKCDLIAMASHGRKGIKGFLLGSETQKVLTHSKIPVLVLR